VECEDVFRVPAAAGGERTTAGGVPMVEGETDHQVAARLQHSVAAYKPAHLHIHTRCNNVLFLKSLSTLHFELTMAIKGTE
jgi:hypothetical protein